MKTFSFTATTLSDLQGMEMTLYKSGDINGSWITWRSCLSAVAEQHLGLDLKDLDLLDEYCLDMLMIDNNIYVEFLDDKE